MRRVLGLLLCVTTLAVSCGNAGESKCFDGASSEDFDACEDFCGISGVEFTGFNDEGSEECGDKTCQAGELCCQCH